MKTILILMLTICACLGQTFTGNVSMTGNQSVFGASGGGGEAAPSYLISEDFEATGNPGWTTNGTAVFDFDETAAAIEGTQSFELDATSALGSAYTNFTASTEVWGFFKLKLAALPGGTRYIFRFYNTSTEVFSVAVTSGGQLRVYVPTGPYGQTVSTVTAGEVYNVWVHYKAGSGADAYGSVAFSSTTTEPADGSNDFAKYETGAAMLQANRLSAYCEAGVHPYYDHVRVRNDATCGNNPP